MQLQPEVDRLLAQMGQNQVYKVALSQVTTLPSSRVKHLMSQSPRDIRMHLARKSEDFRPKSDGEALEEIEKCKRWAKNETMLFEWFVACHCYMRNVQIQHTDDHTIDFLHLVFPLKDPVFLKYELRVMARERSPYRMVWSQEESKLLLEELKGRQEPYFWSDVAIELFRRSGGTCFKPTNACKEQWNNNLSPIINRQEWTAEEDYHLVQLVKKYGEKWAFAARMLETGRTEHMVKNRFLNLRRKLVPKSRHKEKSRCTKILVQKTLMKMKKVQEERGEPSQSFKLTLAKVDKAKEATEEPLQIDVESKKEQQSQEEEVNMRKIQSGSLFKDERCFDIEAILWDRCEDNDIRAQGEWDLAPQVQPLGQLQLFSDWDFDFLDKHILPDHS